MHPTTLGYLKPTDEQLNVMQAVREKSTEYMDYLETHIPNGPDKTYLLRKLREVNMWAMIAITRNPDGSPKQ